MIVHGVVIAGGLGLVLLHLGNIDFVFTDSNLVATGARLLPNLSRAPRRGPSLMVPPIPIAATTVAPQRFSQELPHQLKVACVPREFGALPEP